MLKESLQTVMDILNGREIKVSFINSDSEIKEDGFYFVVKNDTIGERLGIDHWSIAATNKLKVANDHGLYCDGFISLTDAEDIDVFINRIQIWSDCLKSNVKN